MLIALSTPTFDLDGYVEIDATIDTGSQRRRVNRIATLDGGAVLNDFGYSEADRTMVAEWTFKDAATEVIVARMVRLYSRLVLSCVDGVFTVAPESYKSSQNLSTMTLLIAEKLTT